jgi:hypothetical protein
MFSCRMIAPSGHTSTHSPQRMQRPGRSHSSGSGDWLSGLWHHQQDSGQPFKNTVVRMPGPSWMEKRRMSKIKPDSIKDKLPLR